MRGTCFYILGLIAQTSRAREYLSGLGKFSIKDYVKSIVTLITLYLVSPYLTCLVCVYVPFFLSK